MTLVGNKFQPGLILYEVVVGAFKSKGTPFEAWCRQENIRPNSARSALYGGSSGPNGQELLTRLIDGAGRNVVEVAYRSRMEAHVADITGGEAA